MPHQGRPLRAPSRAQPGSAEFFSHCTGSDRDRRRGQVETRAGPCRPRACRAGPVPALAPRGWHEDRGPDPGSCSDRPPRASAVVAECAEEAAPIDSRVHFAGEATNRQSFATVHGAYLSGVRAAKEIAG
ncbi:FAD-dependent oxidoreductase [Kitasatospora sp. NPDC018058]|uniref:FAD-dependent oxidoreductase n=1 Tax=Kitasatospora sp. NPDC018058 TaxID=3364025 RepID=UPI0037C12CDB